MKKILVSFAIIACAALFVFAQDNVGKDNGVVRNLELARWNIAKVKLNSPTYAAFTATTNVFSAKACMIGKVVCYPGAVNDSLTLYNAASTATFVAASTTVAGGQEALELFKYTATSGTMSANSPTLGVPLIFDYLPGVWASDGVIAVATGAASSTTRNWITYDNKE